MGRSSDLGLAGDHGVGAEEPAVTVRSAYPRRPQDPGGPSLTKSSLGVGLETREIVEKYYQTGLLESWNRAQPRFGDFSGPLDLQATLDRVMEAQAAFEALPAEIRDRCQNDPVEFLRLLDDPEGKNVLRGMGLVLPGDPPLPEPGPLGVVSSLGAVVVPAEPGVPSSST